jgi:hypothetical protein
MARASVASDWIHLVLLRRWRLPPRLERPLPPKVLRWKRYAAIDKAAAASIVPPEKSHGPTKDSVAGLLRPVIKAPAMGFPTRAPNEQIVKAIPMRVLYSSCVFDRVATVGGGRDTSPPDMKPYVAANAIVPPLVWAASHAATVTPERKQVTPTKMSLFIRFLRDVLALHCLYCDLHLRVRSFHLPVCQPTG